MPAQAKPSSTAALRMRPAPQPYSITRAPGGASFSRGATCLLHRARPLAKKASSCSGEKSSGGASVMSEVVITAESGFSRAFSSQLIAFQCSGALARIAIPLAKG